MQKITYIIAIIFVALVMDANSVAQAADPWRLQEAIKLPSWLSLSGSFRTRYESLDSQFRVGRGGGDQILLMRTTAKAEIHHGPLTFGAELQDSRAARGDTGTPITTSLVNPLELLQAYLQWQTTDLVAPGATSKLRAGRITLDVGSRRFVARNRFRNTTNAFTGIDWQWQSSGGRKLRAFYTLPVDRHPNDPAALGDNDVEFDKEDGDIRFWGLYVSEPLSGDNNFEFFYFGLDEDDSSNRATRNRELSTFGARLYREGRPSAFDYEFESMIQFGESHASTSAFDISDLDHFAHFQHAELGYTFQQRMSPRLVVQYDYASGDDSPLDGGNERFDTLFGARRFDFGPTSIFGPFARANLATPGIRLQLKPQVRITSFIAYRAYWLASNKDAWTTSRARDSSGITSSFIGHQVEARLRWNVVPKNIRLEFGFAHLFAGEFIEDAPNSNEQGDSTHLYSQIALTF
jgi:hypothetical protein